MRTNPFYISALLILLLSCSKDSGKNSPATTNLSGHAFYFPVNGIGTDSIPLNNVQVHVADRQTGNFYNLITDSTGLFALPFEPTTDTFELSVNVKPADTTQYNALYVADTVVTGATMFNVRLVPKINDKLYNSALLVVTDTNRGPIANATVIGYGSGALANIDTGYNGYGAIFQLKTNSLGKSVIMQLPAGPFYIRSQFQADTGKIQLRSGVDTITMGKFQADSIRLK